MSGCGCATNHSSKLTVARTRHVGEQFHRVLRHCKHSLVLVLLNAGHRVTALQHGHTVSSEPRSRSSFVYFILGVEVCRAMFLFVYCLAWTRLARLKNLAAVDVCFPEPHGNKGKAPWNQLTADQRSRASEFIKKNYASVHGLPMPAAPRGRALTAPTYLPASNTFVSVHTEYCKAEGDATCISLSSFKRIWRPTTLK